MTIPVVMVYYLDIVIYQIYRAKQCASGKNKDPTLKPTDKMNPDSFDLKLCKQGQVLLVLSDSL